VHPDAQKGYGGPLFTCVGRMVTGETSVSSSDKFMWLGCEAVLANGSRTHGLREGLQFRSLCPTNYQLPVTTASVSQYVLFADSRRLWKGCP